MTEEHHDRFEGAPDDKEASKIDKKGFARGFSLESTAKSLDIPKENWKHPEVHRFIRLVNRVENLQMDLSIAQSESNRLIFPEKDPANLAKTRELLNSPDMRSNLVDRYSTAELLLRAVEAILTIDIGEGANDPDPRRYIARKISAALAPLGYEAKKADKSAEE